MKKRHFIPLCALILCMSLLLQGCTPLLVLVSLGEVMEEMLDNEGGIFPSDRSELDIFDEPDKPSVSDGYTSYEDYERPVESFLEPIPFSQISYSRPDADALCEGFRKIQAMVEDGTDAQTVLDAFMPLYEDYTYFYTISDYAYIRYSLNLQDSYFDTEYNWCEEQSPLIEQAMEKCYIAMADSDLRGELEEEYFGEGFFEYYDENQIYSNDRVVELMQKESSLQSEYMSLQNETTILWKGEERLVEEILSDPDLSYTDYTRAYELYYNKYNPLATDIFVELVKVRKEIAQELNYESYAHFAYDYHYERDYTPEQVANYTDDIARYLSDYYYTAAYNSYTMPMDTDTVMATLQDIAYRFGGELATAYDFMEAYELYDISSSSSKMPGSYMSYLHSYGMPFMYVSPTGEVDDLLTAAHEFGHFVDGYVNCNQTDSKDCAEVFSQGLEYLALDMAGLDRYQKKQLTQAKLSDSLLVFLSQSCYAEFEQRVYDLPEKDLTAENINALFLECNEKFGMAGFGMDSIIAPGWIDIMHFFVAPYYVISYCVSNDVALQIYEIEQNEGLGMEVYQDLLHHSANSTFMTMVEEAELDSPFQRGRVAELEDFFDEILD